MRSRKGLIFSQPIAFGPPCHGHGEDRSRCENEARRDVASRFVLSGKGAPRGWARSTGPAVTIEQPPRHITLRWLDGTEFGMDIGGGDKPALIDARPGDDGERSSE